VQTGGLRTGVCLFINMFLNASEPGDGVINMVLNAGETADGFVNVTAGAGLVAGGVVNPVGAGAGAFCCVCILCDA